MARLESSPSGLRGGHSAWDYSRFAVGVEALAGRFWQDMERHFNRMVPENAPYFVHTYEGPDDMPAHIKAVLLGSSVTVPIKNGRFLLGTWQGIYLCEHRNRARGRRLVITVQGSRDNGP